MRFFILTLALLTSACDYTQIPLDLLAPAPGPYAAPEAPPEPGQLFGECLVGTIPSYHTCAPGLLCAIPFGPDDAPTTICVEPTPAECDDYAQIVGPDAILYSVPLESDGVACVLPCEVDADCAQVGMVCSGTSFTCGWA